MTAFLMLPIAGRGGSCDAVYQRTRQHSAEGLRVYCHASTLWPDFMTLGWAGPEWCKVESDFDAASGLWAVKASAFESSIKLFLPPESLLSDRHHGLLDAAASRLGRATAHKVLDFIASRARQ